MTRDPHQTPRPGDQFWIGQSSVIRRVTSNDGRVVAYTVGAHTYESPIADFRRMVAGSQCRVMDISHMLEQP